ncbi:MAG: glycosyltransferase, partial [Planctomycetota bacterium]
RELEASGIVMDGAARGISKNSVCKQHFGSVFEIPWTRSIFSWQNLTTAKRRIKNLATAGDYDIVHVHTPIASFVTRTALKDKSAGQKLLYTAHGFHFHPSGSALKNSLMLRLEKWAAPWTDHLVVLNQVDENAAIQHQLVPEFKLSRMFGIGIDLNEFQIPDDSKAQRTDLRQQLGLGENDHAILMIAGYTANKRHIDAFEALAKIASNENIVLILAGSGTEKQSSRIHDAIKRLGISDRVRVLGYRRDIPRLLLACDSTMLISDREGLPRSLMEAIAFGKPIIGTNIRGISDLVRPELGLLVPRRSPEFLSNAMRTIRSFQPDKNVGENILRQCSLETIVNQYRLLYQQLGGIGTPEISINDMKLTQST